MLVANSVVIAVLGLAVTSQPRPLVTSVMSIVLSIAGLILCVAWLAITQRGFDYETYYVLSARELEERYLSGLVKTASPGGAFAKPDPVSILIDRKPKTWQMNRWSRIATARNWSALAIGVIAVVYLLAGLQAIFWQ